MTAKQTGSALLESLIAILIFSMGILAIIGLQAVSIKNTAGAKYRTDASMLANQVIGQMWVDDKTNAALVANYSSPGGAKYLTWKANVEQALPGVASNAPTITIDAANAATVTIRWQSPGEGAPHNYVATARING
ncbi:MAG: prepilin-type cleavage/methylation domain-containing protein [Sulfuricella sp.]|nr:prepilin-type cleavage/methylation domain-containing protein [Sulfuricella sp.]